MSVSFRIQDSWVIIEYANGDSAPIIDPSGKGKTPFPDEFIQEAFKFRDKWEKEMTPDPDWDSKTYFPLKEFTIAYD